MLDKKVEGASDRMQVKQLVTATIDSDKPETVNQLIALLRQKINLPEEELTNIILEMNNDDQIDFSPRETPKPASTRNYIFSGKALWYWAILSVALAGAAVMLAPSGNLLIAWLRYAAGAAYVAFLPGERVGEANFSVAPSSRKRKPTVGARGAGCLRGCFESCSDMYGRVSAELFSVGNKVVSHCLRTFATNFTDRHRKRGCRE